MKIDPDQHNCAIYCDPSFGPTFGRDHDICISPNANTTYGSYSNLNSSYQHHHQFHYQKSHLFLVGAYEFQLSEIEVYQKEKTNI